MTVHFAMLDLGVAMPMVPAVRALDRCVGATEAPGVASDDAEAAEAKCTTHAMDCLTSF